MGRVSRGYGMMTGIAIGFAIWGGVDWQTYQTEPAVWNQASTIITSETAEEQSALDARKLHAQSAVLMDGDSGRILYRKNADMFRPMASTTKIMTCILALENGCGTDICEVSSAAASQPKVHLGVKPGDQFYFKDLLYSLMLESHNDSAVILAEAVAGSVEAFSGMMNQKAREIGCMDTFFITPNGLDARYTKEDGTVFVHGTTAENLARIMRYCIRESPKREEFLEITRTGNYSFTDVSGKKQYSCVNHNALLSMMEGALTGKTGFTGGAGYSYVGALEDEGRTYVLALLGCGWPPHKTYKWDDARTLFSYGKRAFHYREVEQKVQFEPIPVENGIPEDEEWTETGREVLAELTVEHRMGTEPFRLLLSDEETVEQKIELPDALSAPLEAGEIVGSVSYLLHGTVMHRDSICVVSDIREKNLVWFMELVFHNFFVKS